MMTADEAHRWAYQNMVENRDHTGDRDRPLDPCAWCRAETAHDPRGRAHLGLEDPVCYDCWQVYRSLHPLFGRDDSGRPIAEEPTADVRYLTSTVPYDPREEGLGVAAET